MRAVFSGSQRDVSIYRYQGRLYFFVLSVGDRGSPEEEGEYFIRLPEEMQSYWQTVIGQVEAGLGQ